jgi:PIN domain nuclease of toxin-antitoxin system
LLLDTHVLIWWDAGEKVSKEAASAIRHAEEVYVSAVSAWEIAVKVALGRLATKRSIDEAMSDAGFEELPLRAWHSNELRSLPPLHRDPFDRMLIAQALSEGLTIVTRDSQFDNYHLKLIRA